MDSMQRYCKFYFEDEQSNRKTLFQEAFKNSKKGKVLYIMREELEELPELSQELSSANRHYMKMISFMYAKSIESLIESLATLPEWQVVPTTIILEDIVKYCNVSRLQEACSIVALLVDSARSCSESLGLPCNLLVSATKGDADDNYCDTLCDLYFS